MRPKIPNRGFCGRFPNASSAASAISVSDAPGLTASTSRRTSDVIFFLWKYEETLLTSVGETKSLERTTSPGGLVGVVG